ncbi:MAG TPA: alpha/beta hydrolase, partial [Candidatus Limnocylindria bacterium]|nr:alpha/beta hydrolase [Candidatus Limnocylindria bacterium]
ARAAIEAGREARARLPQAPPGERTDLVRRAYQRPYLLIYRTLADPRYLDLRLDPSQRPAGSIFSFGRDPVVGNFGEGLARVMSARGWLSTWSGLSSNASLERTLPHVRVPTLVVGALADMDIYPSETAAAFAASGAADKEHVELAWASHYLEPVGAEGARLAHPRLRVVEEVLLPWLRARWPA